MDGKKVLGFILALVFLLLALPNLMNTFDNIDVRYVNRYYFDGLRNSDNTSIVIDSTYGIINNTDTTVLENLG